MSFLVAILVSLLFAAMPSTNAVREPAVPSTTVVDVAPGGDLQQAVQSGQNGQFVFVLKSDQTVENRIVKPGQTVRNLIVIESGINAGETVVTDGQLRLFPGSRVRVVQGGAGRGSTS